MPADDDVAFHSALEKEFNEILKLTLSVSGRNAIRKEFLS